MSSLSRALKIIREYHRLKQSDAAVKLQISPSFLSEVEKGTKAPTIELLGRYAETFNIPLSSILLFSESQAHGRKYLEPKFADKALKIMEWIADSKLEPH